MLSPKTIFLLLLSLVLIFVFSAGSEELRIAVFTMCLWAVGHICLRRFALPAGFRRAYQVFFVVSFWLLAATNDVFYGNVFGHFIDLFFDRPSFADDQPGSGLTDILDTFRRRNKDDIALAWWFLRFAVCSTIGFACLPFLVVGTHLFVASCWNEDRSLASVIEYHGVHGVLPPWEIERRERLKVKVGVPVPKRDTRYVRWTDDIIFVCGPGGGFQYVVAGDYDGAISRRRGISKEFA